MNDGEKWAAATRGWAKEKMLFNPPEVPLDPVYADEIKFEGYTRRTVYYMAAENCKVSAYVLIPENLTEAAPAIVALHDHSGQFYYGKEKITERKEPNEFLEYVQRWRYGNRAFASELARKGYVVIVPDALGWGERGPHKESWLIPGLHDMLHMKDNLPNYINMYDGLAAEKFDKLCTHMLYAGLTYPGVLVQNDMRSVDLLYSMREVDKKRIGCVGLSMGGLRATLMMAMDERVSCGVQVGFPALYPYSLPQLYISAWLVIPGMWERLPFPDFTALAMPRKFLSLYCENDQLFELYSMRKSIETTEAAYKKAGLPERHGAKGFPVGHQFDYEMQEYAYEWFEKNLANG